MLPSPSGGWTRTLHTGFSQQVKPRGDRLEELGPLIRDLMDTRFEEHVDGIREWIANGDEPPTGGPAAPEASPIGRSQMDPPHGDAPEPKTPPIASAAGLQSDNPWILYWFVCLKAPALVDLLDAHLERRLFELGFYSR